jgi:hypothetical protein
MWFILPIFVLGVWCFAEKKVFWNCLLGAKLLQQMDDIPHSDKPSWALQVSGLSNSATFTAFAIIIIIIICVACYPHAKETIADVAKQISGLEADFFSKVLM